MTLNVLPAILRWWCKQWVLAKAMAVGGGGGRISALHGESAGRVGGGPPGAALPRPGKGRCCTEGWQSPRDWFQIGSSRVGGLQQDQHASVPIMSRVLHCPIELLSLNFQDLTSPTDVLGGSMAGLASGVAKADSILRTLRHSGLSAHELLALDTQASRGGRAATRWRVLRASSDVMPGRGPPLLVGGSRQSPMLPVGASWQLRSAAGVERLRGRRQRPPAETRPGPPARTVRPSPASAARCACKGAWRSPTYTPLPRPDRPDLLPLHSDGSLLCRRAPVPTPAAHCCRST